MSDPEKHRELEAIRNDIVKLSIADQLILAHQLWTNGRKSIARNVVAIALDTMSEELSNGR